MKKNLILVTLLAAIFFANAQNVGINTTNPQASLDVRGSQRIGGTNNYVRYDSATGKIEWFGASLFTPISQQIIKHSASAEGLYAGGGKLDYRDQAGIPVFYSDWTNGNGYIKGNLGIGTIAPLTNVHIFNGASGATPFPFSPLAVESNGHTYINLLSPGANETAILFGQPGSAANGVLMYNNISTPNGFQFRNNGNLTRMVIDNAGNVGIGNTSPKFPISFNGSLGDKISLWTDGSATHYGFGIQSGLLQVFTKTSNDDIVFGYGSSNLFAEQMRIRGNGNVGIGISDPGVKLDIGGRMKIRTGTDGEPGIWLNNTANTNIAGFMGLENDNYVGFYGVASGWKFAMNTQTGALKINGSEGLAGQFLQSNGNAAPEWKNIPVPPDMYNLTEELACTGGITIVSTTEGDVPGLTKTFVLNSPSKVIVHTMIFAGSVGCAFCSGTTFDIIYFLDGINTGRIRNSVGNGDYLHVTGTRIFTLSAGTHTLKIIGRNLSGPDLTLGQSSGIAYPSYMTLQVIPQN
ncbi:MAG: hypothetical protein ABI760_14820 [Ferruginibacter sp.]